MSGSTVLRVDASRCSGGDLSVDSACRATVIDALADRDTDLVRVRSGGLDRFYEGDAAALLLAAGRFADAVEGYDPDIASRARSAPVAVAREAVGRAGPVARLAAETGFTEWADGAIGRDDAGTPPKSLPASVAPAGALGRTRPTRPSDAVFRGTTDLPTGGSATVYDRPDGLPHYHLTPATRAFSTDALDVLAAATDALATGEVSHGPRSHRRAVRHAASDRRSGSTAAGDPPDPLPTGALTEALRRHTRGLGVLDELFADGRVTDAFLSAPAADGPVRAVVDGEAMTTNVRLSAADIDALASRVRAASGRAFSRASPTADAALGDVRVAAVTDPASDGRGFALRRRDDDPWTLPRLVSVGSLPPWAAGLLSVAVERGAAILVAGPRGAGKTSLLGALCLEVPVDTRTVLIEDTPELPVAAIRDAGRDVQPLSAGTDGDDALAPTEAVRTALRFGEGALVVGEVRGSEARALYEAMRVGAAADAVLGTIHGTGGRAVRERVVSDLGVPASSFATTDLVVTLGPDRALASVEEVKGPAPGDLTTLVERDGGGGAGDDCGKGDGGENAHTAARPTGRIDRGESRVIADLAGPGEAYADVREAVRRRARTIRTLADAGRTDTGGIDAADDR
ncbi:ATPase, T2SS/T4P/T4SS family [Halobaculum magnesiiphilum]|uniref:Flp pilus assembly complex ATPase component TadA n=1 Tax=Halobaculum magnesiiphilum TaxID=1017351 RepID=A0A8T8WCR3_9EURY|nr:ATPase, T2SS/T4P/T4SS family [Halobaculum magnesiiphilum]QZP37611.1 Flp pilus assembly complex ATPase component TadA [Halobaculum magnesiiphilum]